MRFVCSKVVCFFEAVSQMYICWCFNMAVLRIILWAPAYTHTDNIIILTITGTVGVSPGFPFFHTCRCFSVIELLVQTGAHLQEPSWEIGTQLCM